MNFDCSCLWVRDAEPLKEALSLTPHFLRAKGNALDYKARRLCTFCWRPLSSCCQGKGFCYQHCFRTAHRLTLCSAHLTATLSWSCSMHGKNFYAALLVISPARIITTPPHTPGP